MIQQVRIARFSTDVKATSKVKPSALQETSGLGRFRAALLGEIDVGPAGEAVLLVPGGFAVAEQNEFVHVVIAGLVIAGLVIAGLSPALRRQLFDRRAPGVLRRGAELFFDSQQLVVLRRAIAARRRPGLDLTRGGADREIRDRRSPRSRPSDAR